MQKRELRAFGLHLYDRSADILAELHDGLLVLADVITQLVAIARRLEAELGELVALQLQLFECARAGGVFRLRRAADEVGHDDCRHRDDRCDGDEWVQCHRFSLKNSAPGLSAPGSAETQSACSR